MNPLVALNGTARTEINKRVQLWLPNNSGIFTTEEIHLNRTDHLTLRLGTTQTMGDRDERWREIF